MRSLSPAEIGQIAGRAGRYQKDGTFGYTKEAGNLDPLIVQSIKDHKFDDIQKIYWRNSSIDFSSISSVINSFRKFPVRDFFIHKKNAEDEINFSKQAVERINQLIAKKPSGTFFRIAVKGGGCSGFKYDFTFDSKLDENDLKHQNIVVDKSSLDMLKGSEVDFSEELIGNSFKISNPKTKSSCGCGVSFSF